MIEIFGIPANVITGVAAVLMGVLGMITFRRYIFVLRGSATAHLGAALFWLMFRAIGRSVWWDFFYGFGLSNSSNWVWNLIAIYALWHALSGFRMSLRPEDREYYNFLTVAFYPRRCALLFKLRRDDDPT